MTQMTRVGVASRWFALLVATVALAACGGGGSSATGASSQSAPVSSSSSSPPVKSEAPPPPASPPPAATVGTATLSWTAPDQNTDGSPLTNLAGYRIYYGTSANDLDQVISISNVGITAYVVDDLTAGTYYFSIRAYTSAGTESTLSNVVSDKIG
jgi:hypothetical protein